MPIDRVPHGDGNAPKDNGPRVTARPSLRAQADAHRQAKGTPSERAQSLASRAHARLQAARENHDRLSRSPMGDLKPRYRKERDAGIRKANEAVGRAYKNTATVSRAFSRLS